MADDADDHSPPPDGSGIRFPDLEDVFPRVGEAADALSKAADTGAAFTRLGDKLEGFNAMSDAITKPVTAFQAMKLPKLPPQTFPHFEIPPDPQWEIAEYSRKQAEYMEEMLAGIDEQREEDERKETERDAREERALKVAEDSLAEARRSRTIAAWSVAVAVVALIVAVITVLAA